MTLVKFNNRPYRTMNLVEDFFNEMPGLFKEDWKNSTPVNIKETPNSYVLDISAPGLDKNDFKVNLEKNILTISAEKKEEAKQEDEKQIVKEFTLRSFKRSFTVDEKIDAEKIEAKYVNGVLTLNLPKRTEVKASTKEISIQ